jgi:hypothetical protein
VSEARTFGSLFAIGVVIALVGDAGHVDNGITEYLWNDVPTVWKSAVWFPILVGSAVATTAWLGSQFGAPAPDRDRRDALIASALVLALYCLTSVVADESRIVANGICWSVSVAIWLWWDPSTKALVFALVAMVVGPVAEIAMVELGASQYTAGHDQLLGVAPWLMPLYFAVGAVLSGIWSALQAASR